MWNIITGYTCNVTVVYDYYTFYFYTYLCNIFAMLSGVICM